MKLPVFAVLTLACASAVAQTSPEMMPEGSKDVYFGATALIVPRASGSDEYRALILPSVNITWSNGLFLSTRNGMGMNLSSTPGVQYGPLLALGIKPRRADDPNSKLGLKAELGGFLNYGVTAGVSLGSRLMAGGGDDGNGVEGSFGATFSTPLAAHHGVSLNVGASLANSAYMQSYFGLTPAQAHNSRYAPYDAKGGLKGISLGAVWNWEMNTKFSLATGLGFNRLMGSAAESPLTVRRNSGTFFSSLNYHY